VTTPGAGTIPNGSEAVLDMPDMMDVDSEPIPPAATAKIAELEAKCAQLSKLQADAASANRTCELIYLCI